MHRAAPYPATAAAAEGSRAPLVAQRACAQRRSSSRARPAARAGTHARIREPELGQSPEERRLATLEGQRDAVPRSRLLALVAEPRLLAPPAALPPRDAPLLRARSRSQTPRHHALDTVPPTPTPTHLSQRRRHAAAGAAGTQPGGDGGGGGSGRRWRHKPFCAPRDCCAAYSAQTTVVVAHQPQRSTAPERNGRTRRRLPTRTHGA